MTVLPSSKYQEIQQLILADIKSGKYQEGQLIPKEVDLAKKFNVSRPTISHAIHNLAQSGYLERRKKRGTIVKHSKIKQQFTHVISSYNEEIDENGMKATTKVIFFGQVESNQEVASALNIDENTEIYKLVRLRYADNEPVVLVTTYLPYNDFEELENINFNQVSLYQELDQLGHGITHVQRKLEVRLADQGEAEILNISESSPVYYFHTIGSDRDGRKIEYSIATYRGDLNYFMMELDR